MNDIAEGWKTSLNETIIRFLFEKGRLVKEGQESRSYSGYFDYSDDGDTREHVDECGLNMPECSYVDAEWEEFDGTFAEPPWSLQHGIDAVISCRCGLIEYRRWRYEGTHAELLQAITS